MSGFSEGDPSRMPLGRLVALTGQRLTRHWERAVGRRTDLSRTALIALTAIGEHGGLTHRAVAEHCCVTPATLTPVADALEAGGLLRRSRDTNDRRAVHLRLTEDGERALHTAWRDIGAELSETVPRATPDDEAVIRRYLLTVLRELDGKEAGHDRRG